MEGMHGDESRRDGVMEVALKSACWIHIPHYSLPYEMRACIRYAGQNQIY